MSIAAAVALIDRLEADEGFAQQLADQREDPEAVLGAVRAAGFDVTPDEMKTAMLARYGSELSIEQLEALSGGMDAWEVGLNIFVLAAAPVVIVAAAAAF